MTLGKLNKRGFENAQRFVSLGFHLDEEPDDWVTINGNHIPLDENGKAIGGQPKALGEGAPDINSGSGDALKPLYTGYKPAKSFEEWFDINFKDKEAKKHIKEAGKQGKELFPELMFPGEYGRLKEYLCFRTAQIEGKPELISSDQADDILDRAITRGVWWGWFVEADSEYKPQVVEALTSSKEVRSAALSTMFRNYKKYRGDDSMSFEEFLVTPITIYRGGHGQKHIASDVFSSYTFNKSHAKKFANPDLGGEPKIYEAKIRPIDTWGSVAENRESEIFVPAWIAPNGNKDSENLDAEDIGWKTLEGQHVYLGETPQDVKKGNPKVVGKGGNKPKRSDYDFSAGDSYEEFERKNIGKLKEVYKEGGREAVDREYYLTALENSSKDLKVINPYGKSLAESAIGKNAAYEQAMDEFVEEVGDSKIAGWTRNANSEYKPIIMERTLSSPKARNAALNMMYLNYLYGEYEVDGWKDMSFEEFLETPVTLYRGEHGQKRTEDDVWSAYTFSKKTAEHFAGSGGEVKKITVRPIDTIGSPRCAGEAEVMVPSWLEEDGRHDAEDPDWITVNGNHIPIDPDSGKAVGGQQKALGDKPKSRFGPDKKQPGPKKELTEAEKKKNAEREAARQRMKEKQAQEEVEKAPDTSYQIRHRPPTMEDVENGEAALASDLSAIVPEDVYDHPEWYFDMRAKADRESMAAVRKIRDNPEAIVTIYRGAPKGELNDGDWVSLSKTYAEEYAGEGAYTSEGSTVHVYKVKAKDLVWPGDSINEFGYRGRPLKEDSAGHMDADEDYSVMQRARKFWAFVVSESREDEDLSGWVTLNHQHIHFNDKGIPDKGNPMVFGKKSYEEVDRSHVVPGKITKRSKPAAGGEKAAGGNAKSKLPSATHEMARKVVESLPRPDQIKDDADRRTFGQKIAENMGTDTNGVVFQVRSIPDAWGQCDVKYRKNENGEWISEYSSYQLEKGNAGRPIEDQVETMFHEAFHLMTNGRPTDRFYGDSVQKKMCDDMEEVMTVCAARFLTNQYGLENNGAMSYPVQLATMLPELKKLDKYKDCSTIQDFGRVAFEDRMNGAGEMWLDTVKRIHPVGLTMPYYRKYDNYIKDNLSDILDKLEGSVYSKGERQIAEKILKTVAHIDEDPFMAYTDSVQEVHAGAIALAMLAEGVK